MKRNTKATATTSNGENAADADRGRASIENELTADYETIVATYRDAMDAIAAIGDKVGNPIALAESIRIGATNQKMVAVENLLCPSNAPDLVYLDLRDGPGHLDALAVAFDNALKKCAIEYPSIALANPIGDRGCNLQSARSALDKLLTIDQSIIGGLSVDAELGKVGTRAPFGWIEEYNDLIENGKRQLSAILDGLDAFSSALYTIGKSASMSVNVDRGKWMDGIIDRIDPGKSITIADCHKTLSISGQKQWKIITALYSTDNPKGWVDLKPVIGNTDARVYFKSSNDAKKLGEWIERGEGHYRFNAPIANSKRKR